MLRKILKPHIKACFIAKLYQTTLFFNKFFKKKKAQVNKHNPPNSNHLRGSKIQGLTPGSLNSLFVLGFSFLPVTQEDRFKSDLPVFTQQVGITGSFTKRRAAHSFAPQFPLSSLPTAAQMDAPAQQKEPNAFPPLSVVQRGHGRALLAHSRPASLQSHRHCWVLCQAAVP